MNNVCLFDDYKNEYGCYLAIRELKETIIARNKQIEKCWETINKQNEIIQELILKLKKER